MVHEDPLRSIPRHGCPHLALLRPGALEVVLGLHLPSFRFALSSKWIPSPESDFPRPRRPPRKLGLSVPSLHGLHIHIVLTERLPPPIGFRTEKRPRYLRWPAQISGFPCTKFFYKY